MASVWLVSVSWSAASWLVVMSSTCGRATVPVTRRAGDGGGEALAARRARWGSTSRKGRGPGRQGRAVPLRWRQLPVGGGGAPRPPSQPWAWLWTVPLATPPLPLTPVAPRGHDGVFSARGCCVRELVEDPAATATPLTLPPSNNTA